MKTTIKIWMLLVFFVIPGMILKAQNQRFPVLRERLLQARFNEICSQMELEPSRAAKLKPLYIQYEKEKASALRIEDELRNRRETEILTDEQQENIYLRRLERAKKLIEIREKYYHKFREVLSPGEVVQFHHIEMELNRKMLEQIRKRLNIREE